MSIGNANENSIRYIDDKISRFIELKKWDKITMRNKREWISNFKTTELGFAYTLLNKFVYYSEREIRSLCKRLLKLLDREVMVRHFRDNGYIPTNAELDHLIQMENEKSVYTYIVGESGGPAGSGSVMMNHYRSVGVPESKMIFHQDILKQILSQNKQRIIFFDDLIGTGSQVVNFWTLPQFQIPWAEGSRMSLQEIAYEFSKVEFYYLALAGSPSGLEHIKNIAPELKVIVAEVLSPDYNVFDNYSVFWASTAERDNNLLCYQQICQRAGIHQQLGYGNLGLALAFSHSLPDNTLPIFQWEENGWYPLMRRPKHE